MPLKRSKLSTTVSKAVASTAGIVLTAASIMPMASVAAPAESAKQPNIVFFFSDDHANRAISAYDDTYINTPNIDRIAHAGALFENNFVGNSICQPSRAAVMTGKHAHLNGVIDNTSRWNSNQTVFPRLLASQGYDTALIGKWHMYPAPTTEFNYSTVLNGSGRQGTFYQPEFIDNKGNIYTKEGYSADIIVDRSIEWLENDRDKDKPFSLMVQFKSPHTPRRASLKNLNKFRDHVFPEPATLHDNYATRGDHAPNAWMQIYGLNDVDVNAFPPDGDTPEKKEIREKWLAKMNDFERHNYDEWMNRMTPEQRQAWHNAYDERNVDYWKKTHTPLYKRMYGDNIPEDNLKARTSYMYQRFMRDYMATVYSMDESIGRLLDWLEENNLDENTIIVYSSDQSYFIGEHGWAEKRYMYDEAMRMPLMIRWDGKIEPGQKVEAMTQNIDFAPSLLNMAGVEVPDEMQGKSFLGLLNGEVSEAQWKEERPGLYYHYYMQGAHNVPRHDGVRTDRYKLINFYTGEGFFEMYDLENDPYELNNVFENPEYKDVRKDMMAQLEKLRIDYEVPESDFVAPYPFMYPEERKQLGL